MLTASAAPAKPFRATHYADSNGARSLDFATAEQRDQVARDLARTTGRTVYTSRWQPTPQSLHLDKGWVPEAHIVPGLDDGDYITISVVVENSYELYADVTTTFEHVRIPAPPDEDDETAFDDWQYAHIHALTGVGHTDGDSWYDVTVTACSDPSLVGREFTFGY